MYSLYSIQYLSPKPEGGTEGEAALGLATAQLGKVLAL